MQSTNCLDKTRSITDLDFLIYYIKTYVSVHLILSINLNVLCSLIDETQLLFSFKIAGHNRRNIFVPIRLFLLFNKNNKE